MKNLTTFLLCSIKVKFLAYSVIFQVNEIHLYRIHLDSLQYVVEKYLNLIKASDIVLRKQVYGRHKQDKSGRQWKFYLDELNYNT